MADSMEYNLEWDKFTYEQKKHLLYLKQRDLLDRFLKQGNISQAQYEKSLHDLTEKMGETGLI